MHLSMKTSDSISVGSPVPSLFQIAAFFDDFFPAREPGREATGHHPFADFMRNPERLRVILRAIRPELPATLPAPVKTPAVPKRGRRAGSKRFPGPASNRANGLAVADSDVSLATLPRKVEFLFKSPGAFSVRLAGDFTDWEAHSVEMMHSDDGTWFTVVPLQPGTYSYRFIVDGRWCDDPAPEKLDSNPFGTQNAVRQVA